MLSNAIKILLISGLCLLFAACGGGRQARLTLIIEGYPAQDSLNMADSSKSVLGVLGFINYHDVVDRYDYRGGCDTLSLRCSGPSMELLVSQFYFSSLYNMVVANSAFSLLRAGDTVRIRYLPPDKGFLVESFCSPELTKLYQLDKVFNPLADSIYKLWGDLATSYTMLKVWAENPNEPRWPEYIPTDSVLLRYDACFGAYEHAIDSMVQAGTLPTAYECYYRYRLSMLTHQPLHIGRRAGFPPPPLDARFRATLNDSLCTYLSYWFAMRDLKEPLVRPSGNGELPRIEYVDSTLAEKYRNKWTPDQRGVFDRLAEYADSIPPRSLNLMCYLCVDAIRSWIKPPYSEADKQAYLDKYRALTTDFLDVGYANLDRSANLPFRFFIILAELTICMWLLYAVYRYVLCGRLGFVGRRVYLLLALVVSLVVPLVTLSAQLQLVEKTERWTGVFNTLTTILLCAYLLGCVYLLYELLGWLRRVERMRRNSWRIPAKGHTLCILMYDESRPSTFGRSVFFSWDDWWHPVSREARDRMRDSQQYRVRNWHTVDSILLAAMRTLCWANPLLRKYNKELQRVNDLAASNYAYCTRAVNEYAATEEAQQLNSPLVYGLVGNDYKPNVGSVGRRFYMWLHDTKYQIFILIVIFLIVALLVELVTTLGEMSKTSLFG